MDAIMRIINECKVTHFCTVPARIVDLKSCASEGFFTTNTRCTRTLDCFLLMHSCCCSLAVVTVTSAASPFTRDLPEDAFEFLKSHNLRFTNTWWQTEMVKTAKGFLCSLLLECCRGRS